MKRLTEKRVIKPSCTKDGKLEIREYIHIKDKNSAEKKLYDLEDIEEEIGIDLITLFKALKDGIYGKNDEYYAPHLEMVGYGDNKEEIMFVEEQGDYRPSIWFRFCDYGKTWALTKEELK